MKSFRTAEAAEDDIATIVRWYDHHSARLGDDFLEQLKLTLQQLREYPEMYAARFDDTRAAHLNRFTYLVYYRNGTSRIDLLGVLHERLDSAQVAQDLLDRVLPQ